MSIDKRLEGFSNQDICALRLRCVEPYIAHACKYDVEKEIIFTKAEKSWEFMLKGLGEKGPSDTSVTLESDGPT